jgi:predicted DsbA family dithiol-disulfide isomerase
MHIDIYHDTVCPWCRIGKKNLQLALDSFAAEPVTITYRTFFLNEALPPEGDDFHKVMNAKTDGRIPLEMMFDGPRRAGEKVGLRFNFEKITRAPNSTLSHVLIAITPDERKVAMIDALYKAYFEDGLDIGDRKVLHSIAAEHQLERAQVEAAFADEALLARITDEAHAAHQMGITGVPFFVFNGCYAMSGAQPPEAFARALPQIIERSRAEGNTL